MKSVLKWKNAMVFEATSAEHTVVMDAKAPIGSDSAMTPKELVITGLGGCTAMDVVALLKKHKQSYTSLEVEVDVTPSVKKQPAVFENAKITFRVNGAVDKNILLESVHLSQTKFCGVSAMLLKAFPIDYEVILNNESIGTGKAAF